MAAFANLSSEERVGISAAVIVHVALAAGLAWQATREPPALDPPERIAVSLATDVSLESTAPDPSADPAAALAPELGDLPQEPQEFVEAPPIEPVTRPETSAPARPRSARPQPTPTPTARSTPRDARPTPAPTPTATASQGTRGSRLNPDFVTGASDGSGDSGSPAQEFGRAERAALASAITRQLRRHWTAPSGLESDQLVSVVAWRLNRDGSLSGRPRCINQRGITTSNRPQAPLHCERAIRAVTLAAPFNLPEQFYSRWDDLEWDFDRRL